jgi:general secretion pathway protein D
MTPRLPLPAAPALAQLAGLAAPAWAQDDAPAAGEPPEAASEPPEPPDAPAAEKPDRQKPPMVQGAKQVEIDFVDTPLSDLVKFFAEITGRNFILTEDLKGSITIISHKPVSVSTAYEAFISALEVNGYTTVTVGGMTKIVANSTAANAPLPLYQDGIIPYDTDNFVTQIIQLESVSVSDISSVVKDLAGKGAKIIAYAPTNTLIITDAAVNIRRVYRVISQLDVASPKARMEIIPLRHATAGEIAQVITQLYGVAESSSTGGSSAGADADRSSARRRRQTPKSEPAAEASASNIGAEGKFIQKIISDERTNSLIVLANDEAMDAVKKLIEQLDVDVDPSSRAQIHVLYLEHAKAEDVAQVLSSLSQGGSGGNSRTGNTANNRRGSAAAAAGQPGGPQRGGPLGAAPPGAEGGAEGGAIAAFDSGVRIASDENTNSLVIIGTRDQMTVIENVVSQLDIRRKQVFVEAVILELATDDANSFGIGLHGGGQNAKDGLNVYGARLGGNSLGGATNYVDLSSASAGMLDGLNIGVFGPNIEVDAGALGLAATDGSGGAATIPVPAFGIVLNALQASSSVNIVSTPNVLTMDNEEAKIVVGRNVPFPVGQSQTSFGGQVINFQREDVAITLKVTPQINESDYVTLEAFLEVQEIEGDISQSDPAAGGPTTSKRSIENTVVVKDNQTIVIGGLISETETESETKIPVLGDLPLIGALFRGKSKQSRKVNLVVFLTPHIIEEPADLEEVYRVKWAQRQEFIKRFYGRSREEQEQEMLKLLSYSLNRIDEPSRFRGPTDNAGGYEVLGEQAPMTETLTGAPPAAAPAPAPSAP